MKLIIFDLDGVLIETKQLHYEALNKALPYSCQIEWNEHLSKYDGLKTSQKLEMLTNEKGLHESYHQEIWKKKQQFTLEMLRDTKPSQTLIDCISGLERRGYKIACASNSIRKTVLTILSKLNIIEYFDLIISNEDVKNGKPHPEMYWKAMSMMGVLPEQTLIIEDSPYGLLAASRSKSHVFRVKSPNEVTFDNVMSQIEKVEDSKVIKTPKWVDEKLNVLIPMAGAGSRFAQAGYSFPKPLIDVNGKPMIQVVVENLNIEANYIYVVQKVHREKYNLDTLLHLITPKCQVIETEGITQGAACTTLLAKEFINSDAPLLFANSDQFVEWDSNEFMYKMNETNADGGILTFKSTHPKWSFVKLDSVGCVTELAEKKPISDLATVGIYYWKHGSEYVRYAEDMIRKNLRVNNEFYVAPVYNEAIADGKKIRTFNIEKMWGLGTPEDLAVYIKNYKP